MSGSDGGGRDSGGAGGLFVVFEGVEGAGKTSQLRRVRERLERLGIAHRLFREPGGTPVGERARTAVLDPTIDMCAESELFLYLAARAEFVRRLVLPALARGELVLADRYELSTFAYQGGGRGLDMAAVRQANRLATGGLEPDLTILLMIDPVQGRGRQSGVADRLESEREDFHRAVADAYERLAAADSRIVLVRSDDEPEAVHRAVWLELSARWPDRFPSSEASSGNIWSPNEFQKKATPEAGERTRQEKGQGTE